ncbi:MAG: hypothetical protein EPN22_16980 [Nitrospirae bacterium]|nr:MAG: hypothetical protein EPN22_16980 [Nitrospirota bacterium]
MIINQATLAAVFQSFQTIYNQAFQGVPSEWNRIAMRVPSMTSEEIYAWLNAFAKMREWVGDRVLKDLSASDFAIKNKDWEDTISVDRNQIEDDKIGLLTPILQMMGQSAKEQPDEVVFGALVAGFNSLCYDGQYFFDTDHPVGDGTVSNYAAGAGVAWYLMDTTRAIKPIVFQDRRALEFVSMTAPTDANVFMQKKYIYGVDCRNNAGFGLWQLCYASKLELTATNYATARAAMMDFKNDMGKPLGVRPNLLVTTSANEGKARSVVMMQKDAAGADNPWYNTAEVFIPRFLAAA